MEQQRIRVLVVDDDMAVARMARLSLRLGGLEVCTAADGVQALARLEDCRPDVIVLDMQMPVMDGPEFFGRMRARGCRTPVLVLSARNARSAAAELNAESYLAKPFLPDQLVARVLQLAPEKAA